MSQECVVMPKSDWVAALDAVRAQTRTSAPIKSGELAALIEGFKAVGSQFQAIASGSITVASDIVQTATLDIVHGLGVKANFFLFFADELRTSSKTYESQDLNYEIAFYMADGSTADAGVYGMGHGYNGITVTTHNVLVKDGQNNPGQGAKYVAYFFTNDRVKVDPGYMGKIAAGRTYHWICGASRNR